MKTILFAALCCLAFSAQAQTRATSPVSDGQRQNAIALEELRGAREKQECEAAKETLSHNNTKLNRVSMRQACGLPEPVRRPVVRTYCSTFSQGLGGTAVGSASCVSR